MGATGGFLTVAGFGAALVTAVFAGFMVRAAAGAGFLAPTFLATAVVRAADLFAGFVAPRAAAFFTGAFDLLAVGRGFARLATAFFDPAFFLLAIVASLFPRAVVTRTSGTPGAARGG